MSVLTFQLTKIGLKGYELDYDNVSKYYEKENYSHSSGRLQREEEADVDWQQAYKAAQTDIACIEYRTTHNYERWCDESTPYYAVGAMSLLTGCDLAMECVTNACKQLDASKILADRRTMNELIDSFGRAIANALANKKLGLHLVTSKLFYNRGLYGVKLVMCDRTDETMAEFIKAIERWSTLSVDEMKAKLGIGGVTNCQSSAH